MPMQRPPLPHRQRLLSVAAFLLFPAALHAQTPSDYGPLLPSTDVSRVHLIGNDDIVKMARAGLADDVLVQTIQLQPGHYDTTPTDLIALKTAGLSDRVISAMQAHGTGLSQRGNGLSSAITAKADPYALSPRALGLDEIGVYYKAKSGDYVELHTERVVFKSAGEIKAILSQGIINKDMNGRIDGGSSPLKLSTGVELLIYAPAGTDGNEYDFLRLRDHKNYREFRTLTGGIFHSETGAGPDELDLKPHKIAAQMYTVTVPVDIEKGEYGVLPPGSANVQGIAGTGKIFTFSIPE
jgi:hypothetical protein